MYFKMQRLILLLTFVLKLKLFLVKHTSNVIINSAYNYG